MLEIVVPAPSESRTGWGVEPFTRLSNSCDRKGRAVTAITSAKSAAADRARALSALTLTSLIWGCTPVATRFLVAGLAPADILVIRFLISAAVFFGVLTVQRGWRIARADMPRFALAGLAGVTGYNILITYGLASTPAGLGGLILGTEPLCIALFAAGLLGERIRLATGLGLALAMAGTALLIFRDTGAESVAAAPRSLQGPLLVFAAGVLWSLAVVVQKPLLKTYGAMRTSAIASLIGIVPILLLATPHTLVTVLALSPLKWAITCFLAVFGTVISIVLWNFGNRSIASASAAAFIYVVPLVSVIAGIALLNEALTLRLAFGGGMVLAGVAIAQFARF